MFPLTLYEIEIERNNIYDIYGFDNLQTLSDL